MRGGRGVRAMLLAAAFAARAGGAAAVQPPVRPAEAAATPCQAEDPGLPQLLPRLLRVTVNASDTRREILFLQRRCGALLAKVDDLTRLRIKAGAAPTVDIDGARWLNLNAFPGLTYALDGAAQTLAIEGEPWIFMPTVIDLERDAVPRAEVDPGAFVNYGAFVNDSLDGGARTWTGTGTLGLFGEPGVLVSDWLHFRQAATSQTLRVATTFHHDMPERIATLRAGDVFARGGSFGGSAAIGGVQYATNFATRPNLITSPVEMMSAATRRLSVVDLVNSDLETPERRARAAFLSGLATAPHGPVEIVNIPTYQNGEYLLRLRDAQGREYTVRQPFFFSQGLLRQGLHDFSYEAGVQRRSLLDERYDGAFAAATHRYGFTQAFTAEAHSEAALVDDRKSAAAGLTAALGIPRWGVLTVTGAGSKDSAAGTGVFGALGLENSYRDFGYALRQECRSDSFVLPSSATVDSTACRGFGSVSRALTPFESLSLIASHAVIRDDDPRRDYRLGFVTRRWRGLTFNAFAGYTEEPATDWSAGLLASVSLGTLRETLGRAPAAGAGTRLFDPRRMQAQLSAEGGRDRDPVAVASLSSGAQIGEQDIGLQASAGVMNRDFQALSATWSNRYLTSAAGVTRAGEESFYSAGGASGFAFIDGGAYATRPLAGSFAVVRLGPENPGIRVNGYRTDADGDVLLSPMQAYRNNPVAINGNDLPMNARFDALSLGVTPRFRSGAVVRPRIDIERDAMLSVRLRRSDGTLVPLPPGAWATRDGSEEEFPTGEDGAVYITGFAGPPATSRVTIHWNGQQCELQPQLPDRQPEDSIPELGPYVCEGVSP